MSPADVPVEGIGGGLRATAVGPATVTIGGYMLRIPHMFYVPNLGRTILSTGVLVDIGYSFLSSKYLWKGDLHGLNMTRVLHGPEHKFCFDIPAVDCLYQFNADQPKGGVVPPVSVQVCLARVPAVLGGGSGCGSVVSGKILTCAKVAVSVHNAKGGSGGGLFFFFWVCKGPPSPAAQRRQRKFRRKFQLLCSLEKVSRMLAVIC
jgi:hypothetical protein